MINLTKKNNEKTETTKEPLWKLLVKERPELVNAFHHLMDLVNRNNVLDKKTWALIYIGIFSTLRIPVNLRHFVDEAFKAGATKDEIMAAAFLALDLGIASAEMSLPIILDVAEQQKVT